MERITTLKQEINDIIKEIYGFSYHNIVLKQDKYAFDYSLLSYNLCRFCKESPFNINTKINEKLARKPYIKESEVDGGYLKFNVDAFYFNQ